MKKPTLALALGAELAALVYLGYLVARDGYVNALPLGVCLLVISAATAVVYLVTHPFYRGGEVWPPDLDDVWPEDEKPEPLGQEQCDNTEHCHEPHIWESDEGQAGPWQCLGVFMEKDCDVTTPHGKHLWDDGDGLQEPWQCRGVTDADPWLEKPGPARTTCGSKRFHKAHEIPYESGLPGWCPGVSGKRKAASGG